MPTEKLNILVAEVPGIMPVVQEAWSNHFNLTFCCSMQEADRLLALHFDVIVCGTHFAESKMFELLRYVKASPVSRGTPILCVRVLDGELDNSAFQGISLATAALGAAGFVDLNRWRREYGFDAAREKLRDLVASLAEPHGNACLVTEQS